MDSVKSLVRHEDNLKTAANAKYEKSKFWVKVLEVCNASETFQTLMSQSFWDFVDVIMLVQLNDLLMITEDVDAQLKQLYVDFA